MLTLCPGSVPIYRQGCLHSVLLSSQRHEGRRRSFPSLTGCLLSHPSLEHRESCWESPKLLSRASQLLPCSPSDTLKGPGHGYFLFMSLCTSRTWGWKSRLTHGHLIQLTAVCQGVFVDLVNNKIKDWISNTATTAFLHVPTCNSPAPKPSLLLHAWNQSVSGISASTGLDA